MLNLIYPPKCGICGKLSPEFLCRKCEIHLNQESELKIETNQLEKQYFQRHLYIFYYQGIIRNSILNYKFQEQSYLYKTFVNFLSKKENLFQILKSYDTITPVPISKQRLMQRGYNQSDLIAKELANRLQIAYLPNILIKQKHTIEQSKLNKEQRIQNVKGLYNINETQIDKMKGKRILLIDDIYTTGSTANACAKEISKQANTASIDVLTLAKD